MNRYSFAAVFLLAFGTPVIAQYPITGSFPPWSAGSPPAPAYSPRAVPILNQTPLTFTITDQFFTELKGIVPAEVLTKLSPLKGKEYSQKELMFVLNEKLTSFEVTQWKEYVFYSSQISTPRLIQVPAGKPLVGFYKMDGLLVGADGRYPFDTGEYNLAGFAGNARIYGTFTVTLPRPGEVDPINTPIYYCSYRGLFQKMTLIPAKCFTSCQP
jgi:hypothetical protein